MFLEAWCVRTRLGIGQLSISRGRCERGGNGDVWKVRVCNVFVVGGEFRPPLFSFFLFCLKMAFFALMCFGNHIVILHINLYVFGSCVREKGEGVRPRKGCKVMKG